MSDTIKALAPAPAGWQVVVSGPNRWPADDSTTIHHVWHPVVAWGQEETGDWVPAFYDFNLGCLNTPLDCELHSVMPAAVTVLAPGDQFDAEAARRRVKSAVIRRSTTPAQLAAEALR